MKTRKEKRIGNVSARPMFDGKYAWDILLHYPNPYWGKEKEYVKVEGTDYYEYPDNPYCRLHSGCFKHEESCYTLAFITDKEEPDVVSVGMRPWELSGSDDIAFRKILEYVFDGRDDDKCDNE